MLAAIEHGEARNRTVGTGQIGKRKRGPLWLAVVVAACNAPPADQTTPPPTARPAADCPPLETRPAEAPDQSPAFPGQTRACGVTANVGFEVDVVAAGLEHPWAVEPLPDGGFLVTERPGRMRIVSGGGEVGPPIEGLPPVDARDQGGLLDVELSPGFVDDRTIFWSFSEPRDGGNATSVARGVLSDDGRRVDDVQVILRTMPTYDGTLHFGSRLAFGPDGMLYVTTGDRSDEPMRMHAQELDNHLGKVLRIEPDGSVPDDNPFVDESGALPEVWSLGHRNIQAMAFDPEGRLWIVDHGPRGGDELNLIEPGQNYGWPVVTYGIEYSGEEIEGAETDRPGFERPVYYWDPVIAPSGAVWYTGDVLPDWRGSLFIGALRDQRLVRLVLEDNLVAGEEHLLTDRGQRIRDVRQGPDGMLYMVTDEANHKARTTFPFSGLAQEPMMASCSRSAWRVAWDWYRTACTINGFESRARTATRGPLAVGPRSWHGSTRLFRDRSGQLGKRKRGPVR